MKRHPVKKTSSANDEGDADLYVRPFSIKMLVPVSLAVAAVVAVISFSLGNEALLPAGQWTRLRIWGIRVLVLLAAFAAGWQVKRRRRIRSSARKPG
jgi:hypothetical protein